MRFSVDADGIWNYWTLTEFQDAASMGSLAPGHAPFGPFCTVLIVPFLLLCFS